MKKISLFLLFAVLVYLVPVNAQVVSGGGAIRNVSAEPTGSCSTTEVRQYQGSIYTCSSGTWTVSSGGVSDATITAKGKAKLGGRAVYAVGSLPTCNSSSVDTIVSVSDKNKGRRECREVSSGVYKWVDPSGGKYHGVDFGIVCDGSTDNTAAFTAMAAAAYVDNGNAGAEIVMPPGNCKGTFTTLITRGIRISGAARYSTVLQSYTSGAPALKFNGAWYGEFGHAFLAGTGTTTTGQVLDIDGNYDLTNTLRVQGMEFNNLYVQGTNYRYGVTICKQGGGSGQCSEMKFKNMHITNTQSGTALEQWGANALNNSWDGGNSQANKNSIVIHNGNFHVTDVGFQDYAVTGGLRQHIDNGASIQHLGSADDISSYEKSRFEGANLLSTTNGHRVVWEKNPVITVAQQWQAAHAYTQGDAIIGVTGAGGTGKIYVAMNSGTSHATTEPTWPAVNVAYGISGGSISNGDKTFSCGTCGNLYNGTVTNGMGIVIDRGGGSAFYSTMDSWVDNNTWELNDAAPADISDKAYHIGPTVVDNGVTWIQYEFNAMDVGGGGVVIRDNVMGSGRIHLGSGSSLQTQHAIEISGNTFPRTDFLTGVAGNYPNTRLFMYNNTVNLNGGPNTGGAATAYPCSVRNGGPAVVSYLSPFCIGGQTLVWTGGTAGVNAPDISLAPDFTNNWLLLTGGLKLGDLTADKLLYINADKKVSTVTVGTGLSFSGGTLSSAAGATANSTTGVVPYLSASNTYTDSQLSRVDASTMRFTGASQVVQITGSTNNQLLSLNFTTTSGTAFGGIRGHVGNGDIQIGAFGASYFPQIYSNGGVVATFPISGLFVLGSGTGASYPALKRNSTGIDFRLGDDSAYAPIASSTLTLNSAGTATATAGAATLNNQVGVITSESLTTAAGASYTLTLTNSLIASTSRIFVSFTDGTNTQGTLELGKVTPGSGSATIVIRNTHASEALNGTIKISYMVF